VRHAGPVPGFSPLEAVYGNQDLAPLVQLNLSLVKAKLAEEKK